MKELYIYTGIVDNYLFELVTIGILLYAFVANYSLFKKKSPRKFLKIWLIILFVFIVPDLFKIIIISINAKKALTHKKTSLVVCGKINNFVHFHQNREKFSIKNVSFRIRKSVIRTYYNNNLIKQKNFKANYIKVLGENILIRLWEVPKCQ